jgi:hypothetical protein
VGGIRIISLICSTYTPRKTHAGILNLTWNSYEYILQTEEEAAKRRRRRGDREVAE